MQAIRKGLDAGVPGLEPTIQPEPAARAEEAATETNGQEPAQKKETPYPWILHPVIDILFCCGGALWLLLFAVLAGFHAGLDCGPAGVTLLLINGLGQVFFADAHQPATLWRVYMSPRTRQTVGAFVTICGIATLGMGVFGLYHASFTAGLVVVTLAWSIQHLLAQAYGVSLIYCYKRGYMMSNNERQIFYYLFQTGLAFCLIRMFTYSGFASKDLYGLKTPFWGPLPEWVFYLALACFQVNVLLFVGMVARKYMREKRHFPLPALATTITALMIPMLNYWEPIAFVIFIQTFYHASQYIVVTTAYYLKEQGLPENVPLSRISSLLLKPVTLKYIGVITVLGLLMFVALPLSLAAVGFDRSVAYCILYCIFNIHHYITDAAIWRMKDPQVRRLLVS
jgi:hypothetical protein